MEDGGGDEGGRWRWRMKVGDEAQDQSWGGTLLWGAPGSDIQTQSNDDRTGHSSSPNQIEDQRLMEIKRSKVKNQKLPSLI